MFGGGVVRFRGLTQEVAEKKNKGNELRTQKSAKRSKELRRKKERRAEVNDFADFIIEIVNPVDTEGGRYPLRRSPILPPPRTETDEIITAISTTAIHN